MRPLSTQSGHQEGERAEEYRCRNRDPVPFAQLTVPATMPSTTPALRAINDLVNVRKDSGPVVSMNQPVAATPSRASISCLQNAIKRRGNTTLRSAQRPSPE